MVSQYRRLPSLASPWSARGRAGKPGQVPCGAVATAVPSMPRGCSGQGRSGERLPGEGEGSGGTYPTSSPLPAGSQSAGMPTFLPRSPSSGHATSHTPLQVPDRRGHTGHDPTCPANQTARPDRSGPNCPTGGQPGWAGRTWPS
eukprot:gene25632-biopygen10526